MPVAPALADDEIEAAETPAVGEATEQDEQIEETAEQDAEAIEQESAGIATASEQQLRAQDSTGTAVTADDKTRTTGTYTVTGDVTNNNRVKCEGALVAGRSKNDRWDTAIGGTRNNAAGTIVIEGGTVTATAGESAAGIGVGYNGGGTVNISDNAYVIANGGNATTLEHHNDIKDAYGPAARIGGGYKGAGATVTVRSSAVIVAADGTDANGTYDPCAGIGSGSNNTSNGTLAINSGRWLYGSTTALEDDVQSTKYFLSGETDSYASDLYQYMVVNGSNEIHKLTYSAEGNTITATCSVEHCTLEDHKVTLTIVAQANLTYGGNAKTATLEGLDDFNTTTNKGFDESDIKYYSATRTESGMYIASTNPLESAPTDAGDYEAQISVEDAIAYVNFTINAKDQTVTPPKARSLTYTGSAQQLVTPAKASQGTVQYALGNDDETAPEEDWSTSVPTGTDAGTYTMWYRVVDTDNYGRRTRAGSTHERHRQGRECELQAYGGQEGCNYQGPHGCRQDLRRHHHGRRQHDGRQPRRRLGGRRRFDKPERRHRRVLRRERGQE